MLSVLCVVLCMLGFGGVARAAFGIAAFDGAIVDANGDSYTQAGGTPFALSTYIDFNTGDNPTVFPPVGWPEEPVKDVLVDLPPGLIGNPAGVQRCTLTRLAVTPVEIDDGASFCPTASQVGTVRARANTGANLPLPINGVFLMEPPPDAPARFGMNLFGTIITLDTQLRSNGDYGVTVLSRNSPEGIPLTGLTVSFWGVPADSGHDAARFCDNGATRGCPSQAPRRSLLRLPTRCTPAGTGLITTARVDSWFNPGNFVSASFESHLPPGRLSRPAEPNPALWGPAQGPTNCDRVPFRPSFTVKAATPARAGAPAAYTFDLSMPQSDNPDIPAHGDLKRAVVTFPAGVRVSPSSADGLEGCTPAQIGLDSLADARCPDGSKIGSLRLTTPVLDEPLEGAVYLATPRNNPSRTLIGIYLVAKGSGVIVKLAGRVDVDRVTGQLRTTFDDNPQLPFSNLHLELYGGPRAALVNPSRCGSYTTRAVLTSWSGKTVTSTSSFQISRDGRGAPCSPPGFDPGFEAGTTEPVAGAYSPFLLSLSREDEDQEIRTLSVDMPQGIVAKVAGVPLCSSAAAARGTCGEGSRIGSVTVGAGPGAHPFYIRTGRVYLTEPYKGGPFGLSIVVPAVAGPFDLGDVIVRSSIRVDRQSATLRIVSDPFPVALEGIPLQVRDVGVTIDRERFFLNPTSCLERHIRGTVVSTAGLRANVGTRFEVGECARLSLRPRMRLTVGARGRTGRGASVPLTAKVTRGRGQANLKSVKVSLPTTLNAHLPVVNDACTIAEFNAGNCEKARTGTAIVRTPLLDDPLRGGVFFVRRASGRGLPNMVIALRGQVDVDLTSTVVIPDSNQLSTTFRSIPDLPFSSFTLRLVTGANGALGAARNLCSRRARNAKATISYAAHNGRTLRTRQRLAIRGCGRR